MISLLSFHSVSMLSFVRTCTSTSLNLSLVSVRLELMVKFQLSKRRTVEEWITRIGESYLCVINLLDFFLIWLSSPFPSVQLVQCLLALNVMSEMALSPSGFLWSSLGSSSRSVGSLHSIHSFSRRDWSRALLHPHCSIDLLLDDKAVGGD